MDNLLKAFLGDQVRAEQPRFMIIYQVAIKTITNFPPGSSLPENSDRAHSWEIEPKIIST